MNALCLKDLADKTHRGLRGRVEGGKSAGGLCYGYRVVKSLAGGTVTTGEREIESAEAAMLNGPGVRGRSCPESNCQATEPGRDRWTVRRDLESKHHPRQFETRYRRPEQRAVRRSPDLESAALRQESGQWQTHLTAQSEFRVDHPKNSVSPDSER
jgi:hypothetical protein